ncbi:hypothetical protein GOB93_17820 [Acetobacter musti]|uniref:Type IV secretion system putative lipoprotein virB7 n=1 Tax=Acetobacter musti TaxID=864732 RepID=A0ABX0JT19_9PROT|nr:membrane lipoprotein lipid attachment site-containing protein [Acetobacter musti]NHN86477.1 hypothetical protein [Acetobacter musti]
MRRFILLFVATVALSACGSPVSGPGGPTPANAGPDMDHDMPNTGTAHGAVKATPKQ